MNLDDQGIRDSRRYTVIPRTLCFVTSGHEVLLLRGAADKRLWAGRLNGVGGHVEPDEDPLSAALREVREETGIMLERAELRALVHVQGRPERAEPGVLLFVCVAEAPQRAVCSGAEGVLGWYALGELLAPAGPAHDALVPDLPHLLPLIVGAGWRGALVYGHYAADERGELTCRFDAQSL